MSKAPLTKSSQYVPAHPETINAIIYLINNDSAAMGLLLDMIAGRELRGMTSRTGQNRRIGKSIKSVRTRNGSGGYGKIK
jgi:hypothetical protein